MKRIFDKTIDCYCNKSIFSCNPNCKCYCHIPIWYRNLVWKIQDIKGIGNILIVFFLFLFQPFITIYLVFWGEEKTKSLGG